MSAAAEPRHAGWLGRLTLEFAADERGSRLARAQHEGPLRVQRAFYPEGPELPHVYLLHPPGGVVGGDRLQTCVFMGQGARALLTTPAAQKLYRSAGASSEITNLLQVAEGGTLEWLPSETLTFASAEVASTTRVTLAEGAAFLGWELTCYGMPARGERFSSGHVLSRFELFRGARPLLLEALELGPGTQALEAAFALRGQPVVANLYAVPARGVLAPQALAAARGALEGSVGLFAASSLEELLVVRALAPSVEAARGALIRCWQALRPLLLERAAVVPRIWAT